MAVPLIEEIQKQCRSSPINMDAVHKLIEWKDFFNKRTPIQETFDMEREDIGSSLHTNSVQSGVNINGDEDIDLEQVMADQRRRWAKACEKYNTVRDCSSWDDGWRRIATDGGSHRREGECGGGWASSTAQIT